MKSLRSLLIAFLSSLAATTCGGNKPTAPSNPPPPAAPTVTGVSVSGSAPQVGFNTQFSATASMSNGTTQNVSSQATWQSSNQLVATVSAGGLVTGRGAGTVDISASYQNVNGSSRINVSQPTPPPPTRFSVRGVISDGTSGGVLPGIVIRVSSGANSGKSTTSDSSGRYSLTDMATGSMTLSASAASYQNVDKSVTLGNSDMTVDFVMPRTGGGGGGSGGGGGGLGNGAQVVFESRSACTCTRGGTTISLRINGAQVGTLGCSSGSHTVDVRPGKYRINACDPSGDCWRTEEPTLVEGEKYTYRMFCSGLTVTRKENGLPR